MTARKLVYLPLDKIEPATRNPKSHNAELVKASVSRFGFVEPVVLDERTGRLVAGHGRRDELLARKAAGDPPPDGVRVSKGEWLIPVVCGWSSADDAEAEAAGIALNQSTIAGGWDDAALASMLAELAESERGLDGLGFDRAELDALIRHVEFDARVALKGDPDDVPEPPKVAVTQPGDLWLLGEHRLLCGDATNEADVKTLVDGALADLVFTDPPYGVGYTGGALERDPITGDEIGSTIYADSLPHLRLVAADHAALYLWYADAHAAAAAAAAAAAGYVVTAQVIWVKNNAQFVTAAHYKGKHEICFYAHRKGKTARWCGPNNEVTVWEIDRANKNEFHPTQKPVELAARAITNSSAVGDRVLDLFGGSGSTLIACQQEARVANLLEIDPGYADVICARFQRVSGIVPVRDGQPHDFLAE